MLFRVLFDLNGIGSEGCGGGYTAPQGELIRDGGNRNAGGKEGSFEEANPRSSPSRFLSGWLYGSQP